MLWVWLAVRGEQKTHDCGQPWVMVGSLFMPDKAQRRRLLRRLPPTGLVRQCQTWPRTYQHEQTGQAWI